MPLDWTEAVQDIPQVMALVQKIEAGLKAIPTPGPGAPVPAGGVPVKPYFDLAASCLPEMGALVDLVRKQAAT